MGKQAMSASGVLDFLTFLTSEKKASLKLV